MYTSNTTCFGTNWYYLGYMGSMYYQGDLAPRPLSLSFGPSNLAYGTSVGTEFFLGWCKHKNSQRSNQWGRRIRQRLHRKERNLSFTSSVTEVGFIYRY